MNFKMSCWICSGILFDLDILTFSSKEEVDVH
jgi:hypothetical protein